MSLCIISYLLLLGQKKKNLVIFFLKVMQNLLNRRRDFSVRYFRNWIMIHKLKNIRFLYLSVKGGINHLALRLTLM